MINVLTLNEMNQRLLENSVMLINNEDILVNIDSFEDNAFIGLDQFDNDVEIEIQDLINYRLDNQNERV